MAEQVALPPQEAPLCVVCWQQHPEASEHPLKPAPDGQPTTSIQRYLINSRRDNAYWLQAQADAQRSLDRANRMVARTEYTVALHQHQLKLREDQANGKA
jgi:hypothetical protein